MGAPEYWFSTFRHSLLDLRRYGKACELYYTLHYLKGFFLSLCTVFWYKISLKTCFKGCTFWNFPGGACSQNPLDCVRAHTPMNDIVWPDQTFGKFACSGPDIGYQEVKINLRLNYILIYAFMAVFPCRQSCRLSHWSHLSVMNLPLAPQLVPPAQSELLVCSCNRTGWEWTLFILGAPFTLFTVALILLSSRLELHLKILEVDYGLS